MRANSILFLALTLVPGLLALTGCPADAGFDCDWTVTNDTGYEIVTIEITDSETDTWGADLLGSDTLPDGESYDLLVEPATWDLRATNVDGDTYTLIGDQTCIDGEALATTITLADLD